MNPDKDKKNRENVILLAKHLNTLKKRRSSRSSSSSTRSKSSTRSSKSSTRSSTRSSSSRKSKKRKSKRFSEFTRRIEARMDEYNKILAGLPRNSAVKRMIQEEMKVKTQNEGEMLAKMAAMAESLKAQKEASELQMTALKAEIKFKKEQGEDTAKQTKELQQIMVDQSKTDATIARVEKYGGVLAKGLNASGHMLANVGTALKGATYGVGDLTKALGTNAVGAAFGVGNITKTLGTNAVGAAYGLGNLTKTLGTTAVSGAYALGNLARDLQKNKDVLGFYGFKQTSAQVNSAVNTDVAQTLQKLAVKAPSLKEEQAMVEEIIHTQRAQAAVAKAEPSAKQAAVVLKEAAVELKEKLKEDKAVADKPVSAPMDDATHLRLINAFKMTDPVAKYVEIYAGKKLRSPAIQAKIKAVGSKYMKHLKDEILQYQRIIRDAPVHPSREDEFEAVAGDYVKPFATTKDLNGMKLLFGHYATLSKFVNEALGSFTVPGPQQLRDVNERAVSVERASEAARRAMRNSPPAVIAEAAADAAGAAVAAFEAGPEAMAAAMQGMEVAEDAAAFAQQQTLAQAQVQLDALKLGAPE